MAAGVECAEGGARGWRRLLWSALALGVLVLVGGGALALWSPEPLVMRVARTERAPGGRYEVRIARRLAWPPSELFDPAVVVEVRCVDLRSQRVVAVGQFELAEASDLGDVEVAWDRNEVRLSVPERGKELRLRWR